MYDLYGFIINDLTFVSRELENALKISFELHESLFRGGDYYYYRTGTPWEVELILQRNAELEDGIAEPDFSEYEVLFYAHARGLPQLRQISAQILARMGNQVRLLRSEEGSLSWQEVLNRMRHTCEEVIERAIREFELLDDLVVGLSNEDWAQPLLRPETKDPWTVKDALAHITHWKADVARSARGQPRPPEERGLGETDGNHLIYLRWRDRSPQDVLAWHRQVQEDLLAALRAAPEAWFSGKERRPEWPNDLDGHSAYHRTKDIARALAARDKG